MIRGVHPGSGSCFFTHPGSRGRKGTGYLYFSLFLSQVLQVNGYKRRFNLTVLLILQLVPSFCKNRKIWLPSDTTMVSPALLVKHGVSVSRAVQHPGQFVVVFPK
jgi:hypothetical protein